VEKDIENKRRQDEGGGSGQRECEEEEQGDTFELNILSPYFCRGIVTP
jgi:hypothetical protein